MPEFRKLEDETFVMTRERAIDQIMCAYGVTATDVRSDPTVDYFKHGLSALRALGVTQEEVNDWSMRPTPTTMAEVWVE